MLKFRSFPYDFDPLDNILIDAARKALDQYPIKTIHDIFNRVEFIGSYPEISRMRKAWLYARSRYSDSAMTEWLKHQKGLPTDIDSDKFNIWVTFENRRIPAKDLDLTISFDFDDASGSNLYMPLIYFYLDFLENSATYVRHNITVAEAKLPRSTIGLALENRKFACAFINNPDPVRLRFISELSKFGTVDIFGRSVGRYAKNKIELTNQYQFAVCFENDLFPGYVTEKSLEAWLGAAIPVYWGSDDYGILNKKAIVNCRDYSTLREAADHVAGLQIGRAHV